MSAWNTNLQISPQKISQILTKNTTNHRHQRNNGFHRVFFYSPVYKSSTTSLYDFVNISQYLQGFWINIVDATAEEIASLKEVFKLSSKSVENIYSVYPVDRVDVFPGYLDICITNSSHKIILFVFDFCIISVNASLSRYNQKICCLV